MNHLSEDDEYSGLEISDLMMALVAVFLIGSVLMLDVIDVQNSKQSIARRHLDNAITYELGEVAAENSIEITEGGVMTFQGGFDQNSSELTQELKSRLDEYCPKLKQFVLSNIDLIESVVFEGHTNQTWGASDLNTPYYGNQNVSNARAANTMKYCLGEHFEEDHGDILNKFLAVGHSYTKPYVEKSGRINDRKSKRVDIIINEVRTTIE